LASSASNSASLIIKYLLTLHSAVKDERDIEAQLEGVREQAKELRRKSKQLQLRHDERSPATMSAIVEYTKLECRMLCDKVYDTFPREVRDIIYDHIHTKHKLCVNEVLVGTAWGDHSPRKPAFNDSISEHHWRTGLRFDQEHHLWSADFLGDRVLQELLEWYYHATTFDFGKNWTFIPEFRSNDQWDLGHVPADFVTNIEVTLEFDDWEAIRFKREMEDGWSYAPWNTGSNSWNVPCGCADRTKPKDPRFKLLTALESLFGFRQGTKIDLHVTMSDGYDWSNQRAHIRNVVIPFVLPSLLRLQTAGYKVAIILSPRDNMCDFKFTLATTVVDLQSFEQEYVRVSRSHVFYRVPAESNQSSSKPLNCKSKRRPRKERKQRS
jgi:hypothetical protein